MRATDHTETKLTFTEAAAYLGVSHRKITQMAKNGEIKFTIDPLDKRRKLVKLADLKQLKHASLNRS